MNIIQCVNRRAVGVTGLLVVTCTALVWAAAGALDPSWGGTGVVTTPFPGAAYAFATGVAVQDGGMVIAVGGEWNGTDGDFALARYNKDGSLDTSFGDGGLVTTDFVGDDLAAAAAFQGDKLVVAGYNSPDQGTTFYFALARYNKDGSLDQSFGTGGKVVSNFSGYDFADAVVVKGDKIVVAGESQAGSGGNNFAVARYNKNGTLDGSFGTGGLATTDFHGGFDSANGVAMMGDKIVVAGYVRAGSGDYNFGLVRYKKDGSLDSSFGVGGKVETDFVGGDDVAHAVDVQGNRILAVGFATNADPDFAAAQYDDHGVLDPAFGAGGKATLDLGGDDEAGGGEYQDGKGVVAGGFTFDGVSGQFAVVRWTKSGTPDLNFGGGDGFTTTSAGADSYGYALAVAPADKIVVAGEDFAGGQFAVVRYLGK